jgi:glutamate synthase (ferredoxin)
MYLLITVIVVVVLAVLALAIYDLFQTSDPICRNYPVVGHGRHFLSELGPKLRQYIVADNNEERPFNRDDREWVYRSAAKSNNYFGFGTDNDIERESGYLIIKQSTFPLFDPQKDDEGYDPNYTIESKKVLGEARGRKGAFRPSSIINISAMSYGSLSGPAVEAMSRGAKICGCMQNTGEGGVAPQHDHGADLIWQLGTGYYGARAADGTFDEKRFVETCQKYNVKAIEIKLSQGAKPGRGGVLPGKKVTPEIAAIRGIPVGKSCLSPNAHRMFSNADEMLDFVEHVADLSGVPVGIKSAVGQLEFWRELTELMQKGDRGIDYLAIDGGEGGTGAAPLTFSDHVSLPFRVGFQRVHQIFDDAGLTDKVTFIGAGKLGFPEETLLSMAMGCDLIYVARTAMMAIGCIQAQICHTGKCPTGVATQDKWLMRGLDPTDKSARLANYVTTLRKEVLQLCRACGVEHPAEMTLNHFEVMENRFKAKTISPG